MCELRKLPEGSLIQYAVFDGLAEEGDRVCAHGHHWVILFDRASRTLYHAYSAQCPDTVEKPQEEGPTFANFRREAQAVGYQKALAFANAFRPNTRRDMILSGGVGLGKTHLARAAMAFIRNKNYRAEFVQAATLARTFHDRESWNDDYQARADAKEKRTRFLTVDLLILDDLGSERVTKTEMFNQALLEFWDERRGSWLITTNLSLLAIRDRYGEKIHSRMVQYADLVPFTGRDYRQAG